MKRFVRRSQGGASADAMTITISGGLPADEIREYRFTTPSGKRWLVRGGLPNVELPDQLPDELRLAIAEEARLFNKQQLMDIA